MSPPLSPRSPASVNRMPQISSAMTDFKQLSQSPAPSPTPSSAHRHQSPSNVSATPSSPFQTDVAENSIFNASRALSDKENVSPPKTFDIHDDSNLDDTQTATIKFSPQKPFVSGSSSRKNSPRKPLGDETLSRMREDIYRAQPSSSSTNKDVETKNEISADPFDEYDARSIVSDDTCFSTFSAVPNADMTLFANLGMGPGESTIRSPLRRTDPSHTPKHDGFYTPGTSRRNRGVPASQSPSPSPTPRQQRPKQREGDTTNLLLDFTQQLDNYNTASLPSLTRRTVSPTKTEPNLLSYLNNQRIPSPTKGTTITPGGKRNVLNLLDFDLPPQPTPRSVPSITVREMESLKSSYLSEISSLKATLSGKEAEVESLKKAVNDAERRVGEALENVREERDAKEHAESEKVEWEKKGQEVECVLQNVREEFLYAEREKEELLQKLEESNRLREEAELNAAESATKAAVAKSEVGSPSGSDTQNGGPASEIIITQRVAQQLDEKMENLARELHAVYKKKHESKVATLKKTYEVRSEKKCNELQRRIDDLSKQNDELQASKDATFSGELPSSLAQNDRAKDAQQLESQKAELQEQKAQLAGLAEEVKSMRRSNEHLLQDLERERVEKGELVAAVDEMLALQSEVGAPSAVEDFRKSIGRPASGLKAPGSKGPPTGLAKPTNFGKSKMMSNIERMGGGR